MLYHAMYPNITLNRNAAIWFFIYFYAYRDRDRLALYMDSSFLQAFFFSIATISASCMVDSPTGYHRRCALIGGLLAKTTLQPLMQSLPAWTA